MPGLQNMVQGDEAGEAMNLQNYCELSNVPPDKKRMKRQKVKHPTIKDYHRLWPAQYKAEGLKSKDVPALIDLMAKALSSMGYHSDCPELLEKIQQAMKMAKGLKF